MWSVGIILFVLLGARHPFPDTSPLNYIKSVDKFASMKTERDRIVYLFRGGDDASIFDDISSAALSLILSMLKPEPMLRCSANTALKSSWFEHEDVQEEEKDDVLSTMLEKMDIDDNSTSTTPVRASRRRPRSTSPLGRRNTWTSPSKQTLSHDAFGMSKSERVVGSMRRVSDEMMSNRRRSVRLKDYRSSIQRQRKRARRGIIKIM